MQRNTSARQESPEASRGSAVGSMLRVLTRISARWPKFTLALVILACCTCVGYTFFFVRFKTDRNELLDPRAEFHKRWATYAKTFHEASDVTVVVEANNVTEIKTILDELADRLKREPDSFSNIVYKFDAGPLQHKWLQCLRPQQLQYGLRRINDYLPILRGNSNQLELEEIFARIESQIDSKMASVTPETPPTPVEMKRLLRHADLLTASLDRFITNPSDFQSPWPDLIPMDAQTRGLKDSVVYSMSDRGTMGFLRVVPRHDAEEAAGQCEALNHLREITAEIVEAHPGSKIGLTGTPALEADEMRRLQSDMGYAGVLAAFGCLVTLAIGFRGIRHPLLGLLMLGAGVAWTLGFTTGLIGHFNVISLSVFAILMGLGIDFAIIFTSRYLQLRREGWQLRPALMETTSSIGAAALTSALTASLAFLCTLFTDFAGVAEFGIIAAAGILFCALASFFVLPALIALADQNVEPSRLPRPFEGGPLRSFVARFPLVACVLSAVVVVGLGSQVLKFENGRVVPRIRFDYNLLNLQAQDAESVLLEKRIYDESSNPLLFAVCLADSERQMRELHSKLETLPSVRHVESLAMRLPSAPSDETRQLLAEYRAQLAYLPNQVPTLRNADPAAIGRAIESFYGRVKRYSSDEAAHRVVAATDRFLNRFEKLSLAQQTRFVNDYQYRMARDLLGQCYSLRNAANDERIQAQDLPNELVSRFVSKADAEGKQTFLLQVYPREKVWDELPLAKFVADLRSVDPNVTGAPVQNFETARQIKHSFQTAAVYAFAVVWIVLLIDFLGREARWLALLPPLFVAVLAGVMLQGRHIPVDPILFAVAYVMMTGAIGVVLDARNLRDAMIAYIPPLAGVLVMFGLLGLSHVDLNPANLIVLPLILGIGANNGVNILHDFRSQKGTYKMSGSVFSTVLLTALTSIVGFGSLMIGSHRGIFSLGLALAIGTAACLFVALIALPSLLTLLSRREAAPATSSKSESPAPRRDNKTRAA